MNQWYKEGLLDQDFATTDEKMLEAKITGGQIGSAASIHRRDRQVWNACEG